MLLLAVVGYLAALGCVAAIPPPTPAPQTHAAEQPDAQPLAPWALPTVLRTFGQAHTTVATALVNSSAMA